MSKANILLSTSAAALAMTVSIAGAQQNPSPAPRPADEPSATQAPAANAARSASSCRTELQAFGEQMRQDGYWLSGWNQGYGVGMGSPGGAAPMAIEPGATTAAEGNAGTGAPARDPAGQPVATTPVNQSPWGNVEWTEAPRFQIRSLYNAAVVLDRQGDTQTCSAVMAAAQAAYASYVSDLERLGVSPDEVTGWRQEQLLAAIPVNQIENGIEIDSVIGSDVRNPQDESLGEVEDVVFDPRSGRIGHLIVSRGGFLGIGEDRVVVPWDRFSVTPGLNTFVLPVSEQAMEDAPQLEDGGTTGSIAGADDYWEKATSQ